MESKKSLYDIAFDYINAFFSKDITIEEKKAILIDFGILLSDGWTTEELYTSIEHFKGTNFNPLSVGYNFKNGFLKNQKQNLLMPTVFYYHNQLRITTPAPIVDLDYNTGEVKRIVEDYYLEMRASYTIDDLYKYFLTKEGLYNKKYFNPSRIKGGLKYLVNQVNVDIVLFMLDMANDVVITSSLPKLRNIMDAMDYYNLAIEQFQRRITESKIGGFDKIVPRKRVLPS